MIRTNILGQLLQQTPEKAAAMAQRAQALQVDPSFWVPGEVPNRFDCLPLWHCICAFKGMDPAYWALTSPAVAASWERHTTGEVAGRLKELVQLHTRALGGIKMDRLKAVGNEAKGFETDMDSLTEWAALVGEAPPAQYPATDAQSTPKGLKAAKVHTTKETRRHILRPEIEHAQSLCKNKWDTAEVWSRLQKLAEEKHGQLFGATDDGLQYLDAGEAKIFTRDSLRKRLGNWREKAQSARQ